MKSIELSRAFNKIVALVCFASMTLNIASCGPKGSNGPIFNSTDDNSPIIQDDWAQVDTKAFITGGIAPYNNLQIINIDKVSKTVTIQVPLPVNPLGGAAIMAPVPEIPGAMAGIMQDQATGQWYFTFTMPLSYLLKGINFTNPGTLPNGQPLPAIPGGELPKVAAHIQNSNFNFYVYGSVKYFAIFFPTPWFDPTVGLQFPIKNGSKTKILGYFATVPNKNGPNGGLYFSMVFPPELQRLLDDLFHS